MRQPTEPKEPSKYIDEIIYSKVSDSIGNLKEIVDDISEQLIQKGYTVYSLDLQKISYEFDACSSYSSCAFMYKLESEKPKQIYDQEYKKYLGQLKLYRKDKEKFDAWKKAKDDKKKEERKQLYEKLKKEFGDG